MTMLSQCLRAEHIDNNTPYSRHLREIGRPNAPVYDDAYTPTVDPDLNTEAKLLGADVNHLTYE